MPKARYSVRDEDFLVFQSVSQFDTYQISLCLGGYLQATAEPMLDAIGREVLRLNRDSIANLQAEYTLADDREDAQEESDTLDADPNTRNFSYVQKSPRCFQA